MVKNKMRNSVTRQKRNFSITDFLSKYQRENSIENFILCAVFTDNKYMQIMQAINLI